MAAERILAVDDEPRYLEIIRFNLETAGYRVDTARAASRRSRRSPRRSAT